MDAGDKPKFWFVPKKWKYDSSRHTIGQFGGKCRLEMGKADKGKGRASTGVDTSKTSHMDAYNASLHAKPRRNGLCARPDCEQPCWTGDGGQISAFCGREHANAFDLGFKEPDGALANAAVVAPEVLVEVNLPLTFPSHPLIGTPITCSLHRHAHFCTLH